MVEIEDTLVHYADDNLASHRFPCSALVLEQWKPHHWKFCEHLRDHEREVWVEHVEEEGEGDPIGYYTSMICVRCAKSKGYAW